MKKFTHLLAVALVAIMTLVATSAGAEIFFFVDMGEPIKEELFVYFNDNEWAFYPAKFIEDGLTGFVALEFTLPADDSHSMTDIINLSYDGENGCAQIESALYLTQLYGDEVVFLSLKLSGLTENVRDFRLAGASWPQFDDPVADGTELLLLAPADASVLPEMVLRASNTSVVGTTVYSLDEEFYNQEQVLPAKHSGKDVGFDFVLTVIPEETYLETMIASAE